MERIIWVQMIATCLYALVYLSAGCNEAICASVVSKCMLTQSCKCDLKDCTCCKECFNCLSYLYSECCSCVDMCPEPNETRAELSSASYVEELGDGVPGLFAALTAEPDPQRRWLPITFPVDFDLAHYAPASAAERYHYRLQSADREGAAAGEGAALAAASMVTLNCTVAYMSQCMPCDKCRASCRSMGSSSVRWFHDGCCECIGDKCINYGINESRCLACPDGMGVGGEEDDPLNYDDDALDYGEDLQPHQTL